MSIVRINVGTPHERMIGEVFPQSKLFKKTVSKSKHLFQVFDAWGIDAMYFTEVLLPNDYSIYIYDTDEHKHYKISAKEFKKHAQFFHFKNENEDHRAQIFCSRRNFVIDNY